MKTLCIQENISTPGVQMKRHICHLTSVHPRTDTRIFLKECRSLANNGYMVSLVVADGIGNEHREGVDIYDVGKPNGRIDRIYNVARRLFDKAIKLNADIYHLHDPELIPAGLMIKHRGKSVIFDSHEDVPKQFISKPYMNRQARWLVAWVYAAYETWACRRFDTIVAATPFIRDKFLDINPMTVDIKNFPMLGELATTTEWHDKHQVVCYIGSIGAIRGIREMVSAMSLVKSGARLQLGGTFSVPDVEAEVKGYTGWSRIDELGYLDRVSVRDVLARSVAGLVPLHPIINYIDSLPVKMFEYMSAGIPVIASYFPLWREIIEGNDCGICVDPLSPKAIAGAIDFLVSHPDRARQMGENGCDAVHSRYNWSIEENKLVGLYNALSK